MESTGFTLGGFRQGVVYCRPATLAFFVSVTCFSLSPKLSLMKICVSLALAALYPTGVAMAQASNDSCTNPAQVHEGTFDLNQGTAFTNSEMTCGPNMPGDLFWLYTATQGGEILIDTNGCTFDSRLAVYDGVDCSAPCIAFDDNSGVGNASSITLSNVVQGQQYLIQVGNYPFPAGDGPLNIGCGPNDPYEDNDSCATAFEIGAGTHSAVSTSSDPDYYRIVIPPRKILVLTEMQDALDEVIYLLTDTTDCQVLVTVGSTEVSYENPSMTPQPVVVQASSSPGFNYCVEYQFMVAFECFDDPNEPNYPCALATEVFAGSYTSSMQNVTDFDQYKVSVEPGVQLVVEGNGILEDVNWSYRLDCNSSGTIESGGFSYTNTSSVTEVVLFHPVPIPPYTDDCIAYGFFVKFEDCFYPDAFEANQSLATAAVLSEGTHLNLTVDRQDDDWYQYCLEPGQVTQFGVNCPTSGADLEIAIYGGQPSGAPDTGGVVLGQQQFTYQNQTGFEQTIYAKVSVYWFALSDCNVYELTIDGAGCPDPGVGVPFCDPMNVNSTGMSTRLMGHLGSGVESGLHLSAHSGPSGEFGYFVIGTGVSDPGLPLSDGRLCLALTGGNAFGRYNIANTAMTALGQFDANGDFRNLQGTGTSQGGYGYDVAAQNPLGGTLQSGETWHFQLWHRDTWSAPGRWNYSNGVSVTFP